MSNKNCITQKAISNRGIIDIRDLLPGDYVYDAMTGDPIEVIGTHLLDADYAYNVIYSDGRQWLYHNNQKIVTIFDEVNNPTSVKRINTVNADELRGSCVTRSIIDQFLVNIGDGTETGSPGITNDPYLVGPLLMFGDLSCPYVNLPSWLLPLSNKYQEYVKIHYSGSIWFKNSDDRVVLICRDFKPMTWCQALGLMRLTNETVEDMILKFVYKLKQTRLQFVRGVFDVGFYRQHTYLHVAIHGREFNRCASFRTVLNSLGIICSIFAAVHPNESSSKYTMNILHGNIPELFYDPDLISEFSKYRCPSRDRYVHINLIQPTLNIQYGITTIDVNDSDRNKCYLSDNMLPIPLE